MSRPTAQDALTDEELDNLFAQQRTRNPSGKRNLALLRVMADAGLRVGEAVALTTKDLVKEAGVITHVLICSGKGGKPGKMKLTVEAAAKLSALLK